MRAPSVKIGDHVKVKKDRWDLPGAPYHLADEEGVVGAVFEYGGWVVRVDCDGYTFNVDDRQLEVIEEART